MTRAAVHMPSTKAALSRRMPRRAILHIGTEKTGSTTLQRFLSGNRDRLAERGFVYPSFCGASNHTGLSAFALDSDRTDPLREAFGVRDAGDVEPLRARLRAAAAAELAGAPETAIFCNEHCHSRLTRGAEVRRLRDFLAEFFDDVRVSVCLRRQDRVALSLYSTRLKSGHTDPEVLPRTNAADPYFNYDASLALWEEAFGREKVRPRLFDRGGGVVADFLATWAIGAEADFRSVPDANESILPGAQDFLRRINPHLAPLAGLPLEDVRGPLAATLARIMPGQGAKPSRAAAESFYAMFEPSNEAVRARHFPDRARLFESDFSDYPEDGARPASSIDDLMAVAARLHVAATAETRRLEAEIALRDARLHAARSEAALAEKALRRALHWRPDHAAAHRTLAEHLLRQERLHEAIASATRAAELGVDAFEYWHFLGVLHRNAGNPDRAAEAQARALKLNPDHAASRREAEQLRLRQAGAQRSGPSPS